MQYVKLLDFTRGQSRKREREIEIEIEIDRERERERVLLQLVTDCVRPGPSVLSSIRLTD
jgi:hypothetical protein